jgi:hypothetical protein
LGNPWSMRRWKAETGGVFFNPMLKSSISAAICHGCPGKYSRVLHWSPTNSASHGILKSRQSNRRGRLGYAIPLVEDHQTRSFTSFGSGKVNWADYFLCLPRHGSWGAVCCIISAAGENAIRKRW